jgi:hypothetical protein
LPIVSLAETPQTGQVRLFSVAQVGEDLAHDPVQPVGRFCFGQTRPARDAARDFCLIHNTFNLTARTAETGFAQCQKAGKAPLIQLLMQYKANRILANSNMNRF